MEITFLVAPEAADEEISSQYPKIRVESAKLAKFTVMHKAMPIAFLLLALAMFQTQAHHSQMPDQPQPPPGFSGSPFFGSGGNTERPFNGPSPLGGPGLTDGPPMGISGRP
ncbi:hypothetical protein ANCCEY_09569 [Ancylostoma ceylanicum]|uniref:Uncharacterized protein n=1 Tax=Ancylostoma ceylanicum TaxID=53326 RepID=A0A0D6LMU6_9BILA|nr:hypothetical protein ANCCEY_09569 [Ancylostoma ceylanicum]